MTTVAPTPISFQQLLVASDLTDASENAINYAKAIAKRYGSHILLVHVSTSVNRIPIPEGGWIEDQSVQRIEEQVEAQGVALREAGFLADAINAYGSVRTEIQSLAYAHRADLIVLGTHGRKGLERLILGSEAESIMRHLDCPVLTVGPTVPPPSSEVWNPQDIICGINLDAQSAQVAAYGYVLALNGGATFTLFHVENLANPPDEDTWQTFEKNFDDALPEGVPRKWPARSFIAKERPAASIVDAAKKRHSDLIVLGAGHSGFAITHLRPGVLPQVLIDAPCPVLTVNSLAEQDA